MANLLMDLVNVESEGAPYQLVKITPPQTNDADIPVGKGAYCFVIDVSGRCAAFFAPVRARTASG